MRNAYCWPFLVLLLSSCIQSTLEDPLAGFELGSEEEVWKSHVEVLTERGVLKEEDSYAWGEGPRRNQDYRYQLVKGDDSVSVLLSPNPDGYHTGRLRSIDIVLFGDTTWYDMGDSIVVSHSPGGGPRRKDTVDKVFQWYKDRYGEPDSTGLYSGFGYQSPIKSSVWNEEDFRIIFIKGEPVWNDHMNSQAYEKATVRYKSYDYNALFSKTVNKIKDSLTPDDLIIMQLKEPEFESISPTEARFFGATKQINVYISIITREGKEDERGITDVKYDIVVKNTFDEELGRIKDCTHRFPKPFTHDLIQHFSLPYGCSLQYNPNHAEAQQFERIRLHNGDLKVTADIKKVVFEDGEILSDE